MTQQHPHIVRAKAHLKAMAKDVKATVEEPGPDYAKALFSGILTGLGCAAHILDGGTADSAAEMVEKAFHEALGKMLLDGKITAADIKPAPAVLTKEQP